MLANLICVSNISLPQVWGKAGPSGDNYSKREYVSIRQQGKSRYPLDIINWSNL